MQWKNKRAVVGLVAGAAALAIGGSAFACTAFVGTIEINGVSGQSTGSATYVGNGSDFTWDADAGYCGGKPTTRVSITSTNPTNPTQLPFELDVSPADCSGTTVDTVPLGTWDVRWVHAKDGEIERTPGDQTPVLQPTCHFGFLQTFPLTQDAFVKIGTMSIDSTGNGAGTYKLDTLNQPGVVPGPGNICLAHQNGTENNVPPTIPMKWELI